MLYQFSFAHGVFDFPFFFGLLTLLHMSHVLNHQKYGLVLFSVVVRFNFVFMHWVCNYVFCTRTSLFGSFV